LGQDLDQPSQNVPLRGANVIVHYNSSRDGPEKTARAVEAYSREAWVLKAILREGSEIKAAASDTSNHVGVIHALINNVGDIATEEMSRPIRDVSIFDRVLEVDIKGTMMMIHEFETRMLEQGHGAIVNIGSTVVVNGSSRAPQYAAGK
jgi:3-oxoacyl-[acyl-carrier protein] reductase